MAEAVEAEAEAFLAEMRTARLADGRDRLVRHGHGPERLVQTGIGPVPVQRVKLHDRGAGVEGERIRFTSALLPRWAFRTPSLGLPWLVRHSGFHAAEAAAVEQAALAAVQANPAAWTHLFAPAPRFARH